MFGIFNIYKPKGITSRDCVDHFQKLFWPLKVGHAGTLDPIAEGVLLIAVGQAVRLMEVLHELPKSYRGTFWFNRRSESADTETEMELLPHLEIPSRERLESVLPEFTGRIFQRPPIYSAIRVEGVRAYDLARKGRTVEVPEREVSIHQIKLVQYIDDRFTIDVECDGGTYIRSLGRDIARVCGSDAVMSALIRTGVGRCRVEDAIALEKVETKADAEPHLINPVALLPRNRVILSDQEVKLMRNGVYLTIYDERIVQNEENPTNVSEEMIAVDLEGKLRSIMTRREGLQWGGSKNFDP